MVNENDTALPGVFFFFQQAGELFSLILFEISGCEKWCGGAGGITANDGDIAAPPQDRIILIAGDHSPGKLMERFIVMKGQLLPSKLALYLFPRPDHGCQEKLVVFTGLVLMMLQVQYLFHYMVV